MQTRKLEFLIFLFLILLSPGLSRAALSATSIIFPTFVDPSPWAGQIDFRWTGTGASFYKYHINLPSGEAKEAVIGSTFKIIYDLELGNHSWAVSSCEDSEGESCSSWSGLENFTIVSAPPELLRGLVPCGRKYNNPNTDFFESKPCQLADIFLLFKIVLDFLLWRVGPIILVLLIIAIGLISYFSFGSPTLFVQLGGIRDSVIRGYFMMFFAWLIINFLLAILGYQVSIFGRWWEIQF